eukprot:gene40431-49273_t
MALCYYLMAHHKFFQQSVYDLSGLVDSSLEKLDEQGAEESSAKNDVGDDEKITPLYYPVKLLSVNRSRSNPSMRHVLQELLGSSLEVDFPDLAYWDDEELRARYPTMFRELPAQFDSRFRNPCWQDEQDNSNSNNNNNNINNANGNRLRCLPLAYLLGQPKCGTSDLFVRLAAHHLIIPPSRKEVRWFTRGEFVRGDMEHEDGAGGGDDRASSSPAQSQKRLLGAQS